jgi:diadenosine tetraphosphate (Ap4A) HIT family hydrolase
MFSRNNKIKKEKIMENCIFCKIIKGEIPATKMYEDENMIIIKDIEPKAKNHFLCIPKSHFKLLAEMDEKQSEMVKACLKKIPTLTKELGLDNGYRLVINQGDDAGQTVFHLHIHILSGQKMGWTPA